MTSRPRISAISYLNTAPLMWDFEHTSVGAQFDISYTIPSACAMALQQGTADIGIIPAAAYATIADLVILPDIAIAARGAVRSILLVSKLPLQEVRTVALDSSSLTSVALTKVIFAKWLGGGRAFTPMAPDLDRMLANHDAALVIGDPALQVDRSRYQAFDLAEEWIRFTGKPFVFAFWAVRRSSLEKTGGLDLTGIFQRSRDNGLKADNVVQIAQLWGPRLRMSEPDVKMYLTENIYYHLDPETQDGLYRFYQYSFECGALPLAPPVRFHEVPQSVGR